MADRWHEVVWPVPAGLIALCACSLIAGGCGGGRYGAAEARELGNVEQAIERSVPRGVKLEGLRCQGSQEGKVVCRGTISNRLGSGEAEYRASIDAETGDFKIDPLFSVKLE